MYNILLINIGGVRMHPQYINLSILYQSNRTIIYRAWSKKHNCSVILKTINTNHSDSSDMTNIYDEYDINKSVSGKNVIKVFELIKLNDIPALIIEDIEGTTLKEEIKSFSSDLDLFYRYAQNIIKGLIDIHNADIIHGDINPNNIIINKYTKDLKIIDFSNSSFYIENETANNHINRVQGTIHYISPEQTGRINRKIDKRSDIYSLGITLYEMLTGRLPFTSEDELEIIHGHLAKLALPPSHINKSIPIVLSNIIMKLISKMPSQRYQSAFGLLFDIEQCMYQNGENKENFVLGTKDLSNTLILPEKLYGRQKEYDMLNSSFLRVKEGNTELVLVEGFSGIGKSSLVKKLIYTDLKESSFFIEGKFDQYKKDISYYD